MRQYHFSIPAIPLPANPFADAVESAIFALAITAEDKTEAVRIAESCLAADHWQCIDAAALQNPVVGEEQWIRGGLMIIQR